jgi:hypothetical protein
LAEAGPARSAEIEAEQRKLRTLCHDLHAHDDLQIR